MGDLWDWKHREKFWIENILGLIIIPTIFSTSNSNIMSNLQIRQLSPELANVAKTELNENPSKMSEDVEYLRKWLQMQPHILGRTGMPRL